MKGNIRQEIDLQPNAWPMTAVPTKADYPPEIDNRQPPHRSKSDWRSCLTIVSLPMPGYD